MNFVAFHFIRPYWLLAIIPAVILFILLLRNKLSQGNWSAVCDTELLPFILQDKPLTQSRWMLFLGSFSSLLVILSLAGPTWERLPSPVFRNDAALVIALDLSRSMDADDIKPSRLSRARYKITDILNQRKDGQTALLVYAGDAFSVTPLTEDTETIASQLSALTTDIMPSQGSNTVLAIEKAIILLKQAGLQAGDILLVTDGVDIENTDTIESLENYRLSILGIGTAEGAPIKLTEGSFLKDTQGNIVIPKLNNQQLSRLARQAQGIYQMTRNDDSDINRLLNYLDQPKEKQGSQANPLLIEQWDEKAPWLLLWVLPFAALHFRKGLLSLTLICLLPFPKTSEALEWDDLWQTQNQQAEKQFKQKNYQQAAEKFDNPQWKAAAQYRAGDYQQAAETLKNDLSASGLYNRGNALAQLGQLEEALKSYEHSLQQEPDNEDAQYNKASVEKVLKEQQKQQQQSDNQDQSEQKQDSDKKDQQGDQSESSDQQENTDQNETDENNENTKSSEQEEKQQKQDDQQADESIEDAEESSIESSAEYDESEQANEQWLKRIPDDPAGLLKRKFKYQYGQRKNKTSNTQNW